MKKEKKKERKNTGPSEHKQSHSVTNKGSRLPLGKWLVFNYVEGYLSNLKATIKDKAVICASTIVYDQPLYSFLIEVKAEKDIEPCCY